MYLRLYYHEKGNSVESHYSRCGVRQGCVLGAFLFCLAMRPVYARLATLLGHVDALYIRLLRRCVPRVWPI
jgi:uncharacterized membrane protein